MTEGLLNKEEMQERLRDAGLGPPPHAHERREMLVEQIYESVFATGAVWADLDIGKDGVNVLVFGGELGRIRAGLQSVMPPHVLWEVRRLRGLRGAHFGWLLRLDYTRALLHTLLQGAWERFGGRFRPSASKL